MFYEYFGQGIERVSEAKTKACLWSEANAVALESPVFAKQKWPRIFAMFFFHIDQTAKKRYIFNNPLRLRMKFPFDHKENIQDEKV
ncbi:hypothetical protein [Treponema sp.]|uniref:hypothetical protein n=1 Tax=Treponema sp. TaxID=166 RepID=UPI003FD77C02